MTRPRDTRAAGVQSPMARRGHDVSEFGVRSGQRMYGIMYGMHKTTVYLTPELRESLRRAAEERRVSEAELVRRGIALVTADAAPEPTLPLFASGDATLAERADELLAGFGDR
jgi:hypothetical protein